MRGPNSQVPKRAPTSPNNFTNTFLLILAHFKIIAFLKSVSAILKKKNLVLILFVIKCFFKNTL